MGDFACFLSYVRNDNAYEEDRITRLRERLEAAARVLSGAPIRIFQDRRDIALGENWQAVINNALDNSTLLLPVITPSYFNSQPCLEELRRFRERQANLNRNDLIIPLYYIETPWMTGELTTAGQAAKAAAALRSSQYENWLTLRCTAEGEAAYRQGIEQLAQKLCQALQRAAAPSSTGGRQPATKRRWPEEEDGKPESVWLTTGTPVATAELASLRLHEPQPGNEPGAALYVRARLRLGTRFQERENGPAVYIALRNAFLLIGAAGYAVEPGSLIGERGEHPNFRAGTDANEVEVVGPRQEGGCLDGDPLDQDYLARIKSADDGKGEEAVTASLYVRKHPDGRGFAVSLADAPPASHATDVAATEKDAVLNILIGKRRKDSLGRTLVAQDRLTRKPPE